MLSARNCWSNEDATIEFKSVRIVLLNIDEALKADGSVVTWGDGNYGGDAQEAYPA